jgi:hypothetical protein
MNSNFEEEWQTQSISSITGKTIVPGVDDKQILLGESIDATNFLINTILVNSDGSIENGNDFRTLLGSVETAKPTLDGGLILIGSTNATFGTNVQLIKTGQDLYLLKP